MNFTLQTVKDNPQIKNFVRQTEKYLDALGYTDHGFRHVNIVSERARSLAKKVGLTAKEQELSAIAGYCHDLGNFLGRSHHHYWATMFLFQIFSDQADPNDLSQVMQAISGHDKEDLKLVNKIAAVLILADKSDVHRDRVRTKDLKTIKGDIHDRVNYSVIKNEFLTNSKEVILKLKIDSKITDPLEYFEIFLDRMTFCRQAAKYLNRKFVLIINNFKLSS